MAIEKMKFVNFVGKKDYLDEFIHKYMTSEFCMQPESAISVMSHVKGIYAYKGGNLCTDLLRRCGDLMLEFGVTAEKGAVSDTVKKMSFDELQEIVDKIEEEFDYFRTEKVAVDDVLAERRRLLEQISRLGDIDTDLSQLFDLRFFKIRFGRLSKAAYERILPHLDQLETIMLHVSTDEKFEYIIYLMPAEEEVKVDGLFHSYLFERSIIPDGLSGTPAEICFQLSAEINAKCSRSAELAAATAAFISAKNSLLQQINAVLLQRDRLYEIKKYVAFNRESFYIVGWMPERILEKVQEKLEKDENVITIVDTQNAPTKPPTKLKNNFFFRPFEPIVTMYGLPSYDEIDPTSIVAFLYCLMVGFMFGDVGQGLVFFLAGIVFLRRKSSLGGVFFGGGLCSMIFGFLYGSVFSMESVIKPLFMNPMESANINTMLMIGIGIGVVLLLLGMVMNMANAMKSRDIGRMLFDRNGLAGMVFYLAVIGTVVSLLLFGKMWASMIVLVVSIGLPFLIIFFKHPLENLVTKQKPAFSKGGFFVETIFEMVDMLLSFASNTISFVRLSAFAINHVGLSMAFLTLSNMLQGTGSVIVMVVGNILIIALEGLIVGIQGLRLLYYELFSRFFQGEGREYEPIGSDIE